MKDDEALKAIEVILVQTRNGYHVSDEDISKCIAAIEVVSGRLLKAVKERNK